MRKQPRDGWGRFSSLEEEKRTTGVYIRLTPTEYAALRAAARREDMGVAELLTTLMEAAGLFQSKAVRKARTYT